MNTNRWRFRRLRFAAVLSCALIGQTTLTGAPPPETPSASFPVTHMPAATIAGRVQELLEASGLRAELIVDRTGNRLVVRGDEQAQRIVGQAVSALDLPAATRAAEASTIQPLPMDPQHLAQVANALQLRYGNDTRIRIAPDRRTNQLLILAPAAMQDRLRQEALQMSGGSPNIQPAAGEAPAAMTTQRFAMRGVSWQEMEDRLQRLAGARPVITTKRNGEVVVFQMTTLRPGDTQVELDRRNGEIQVTAPQPAQGGWRQVIQTLDQPLNRAQTLELVRLVNAEPAPIQKALRLMHELPANTVNTLPRPNNRMQLGGPPAAMVALQDPNAPANPAAQGGNAAPPAATATIPAENAAAAEAGAGVLGDVQVEFVPELGVLVIRGAKRDVQRVMDVIKQIEDQSTATQPEIVIQPLQHINAAAAAALATQLYDSALAPRQGTVSITSLDTPNAVLLIGRKEAVTAVQELLQKLDQPAIPSAEVKVFRLKHASAVDAETTVRDFFTTRPGSEEELRPALGSRARVVADYRTNSLIVQAAPRDLQQVATIIAQLDVDTIPATSQLQVFKLRNSLAEDLAAVLTTAITPAEDGDDGRSVPSTRLSILSVDSQGNRLLDSGLLTGVVITADTNGNSLVVRAPSSSMPLIAELIKQLDQLPGGQSNIKVFTIQNGDASLLVSTLQQLFALQTTTGTTTTTTGTASGAAGPGLGPTQLSATTETTITPIRLAVDRRTNSIIATGSEEDLRVVEALLARLDTEGLASRITEVIWLRHATSTNVATALQDYVTRQLQTRTNSQLAQASGLLAQLELDLIVADEPVTNSLIISVAPRLYDVVRRMIDQLDRRPPMVMIKVVIAEVSLTDGFEFGAELGFQDSLLFDRSVASAGTQIPGFNFNDTANPLGNSNSAASLATRSDVGVQSLSNFLVGRSSSTFGYGGFVLSAASDSVNLLLRALQDSGRVQILSRPQITTLDNTEGEVFVGESFPRITGVTNTGTNNVVSAFPTYNIEDVQIGLILSVRPRVGADGLIIMDIDARRSDVDFTRGQALPTGTTTSVLVPSIPTTQAISTITAYSNQTVIYGGLIQKTKTQISRRVPYVSDIPILGNLFRFDREQERRSELLIIMTPMVVASDQDVEYIKITESSRMSWCLADLVEMHGPVGLSPGYGLWGPAVGATIYPDLQPTVDDLPPEVCHGPVLLNGVPTYAPTNEGYFQNDPGILMEAPMNQGVPTPATPGVEAVPPGVPTPATLDSARWSVPPAVQPVGYQQPPTPTSAPGVGDVIQFPFAQ